MKGLFYKFTPFTPKFTPNGAEDCAELKQSHNLDL
jgi:hypothetical protein